MKTVMVRYKVKDELAQQNEQLIARVFRELQEEMPPQLRYAAFKLPDGVSFIHVASFSGSNSNPLLSLPAFKQFIAAIKERCVEAPVSVDLEPVGTYAPAESVKP